MSTETIKVTVKGNCVDSKPPEVEGYRVRFTACHGHQGGETITWTYVKEDK